MLKRFAYLLISLTVFFYDQISSIAGRTRCRKETGSCTVLNYHTVTDDLADRFLCQMKTLIKLAQPISAVRCQELFRGTYIALTFDDAFSSFVRNAWPILRDLRIPVTVFVPTSYLGRQSAWVDYGGDNPVGEEVMSAKTLLEIAADELLDIGSHTATHADLVNLTDETVRQELKASRETLETMLGREIDSISFPYGSFGDRELRFAREAGYRYQFSVLPRRSSAVYCEGLIGRVSVHATDSAAEFRLKVLGAYRWVGIASDLKHRIREILHSGNSRQRKWFHA